jgi:hypothetical protein
MLSLTVHSPTQGNAISQKLCSAGLSIACSVHCTLISVGEVEGDGVQEHVINTMCDMTQFVIMTPVPDTAAHVLAPILVQEVLL